MACNTIRLDKNTVIIACGPRRRASACAYCSRPRTKQCDFKSEIPGGTKVCDKSLCDACAKNVGPDKDHCRIHEIRGDKEIA